MLKILIKKKHKCLGFQLFFGLISTSDFNFGFMECSLVATFTNKKKLNPFWATGFSDGDSSFTTILSRDFKRLTLSFEISLHSKDVAILYKIKGFFSCGNVSTRHKLKRSTYRVTNLYHIQNFIIPHFKLYPLCTHKQLDFKLWEKIAIIMSTIQDRTPNLIENLTPYIAAMYKGLTVKQKLKFPNVKVAKRGTYVLPDVINPYWMSGFVAAEGCFYLLLRDSGQFTHIFSVTQDHRDLELFEKFNQFFNCGKTYHRPKSTRCDFMVQNRTHINDIIIPFFIKYPLVNIK